ncbi:MAG: class I SAM-dependent methyltransferase [Alphaproteobacteria bacterium]
MSTWDDTYARAAQRLFAHLLSVTRANVAVHLWQGSVVRGPGTNAPRFSIVIKSPGTLSSIVRWPTLETVARQYALGNIDIVGASLIEFLEELRAAPGKLEVGNFLKPSLLFGIMALLWARDRQSGGPVAHLPKYSNEAPGHQSAPGGSKDFVRFHYDISDDFYKLFLDRNLVYSCGYFTDWDKSLDQAQADKLDMICRKLQLAPGERFLDIGCGWGALVCHAARHFGVVAHGVTLSRAQYDYAIAKIKKLDLADQVTVELRDYTLVEGTYDKIASIGMYEHIGIDNYPAYFGKIYALLRDRGLVLNHGIARQAMASARAFRKIGPTRRLILKYIFPGSELDHIGHTLKAMEIQNFEIHDVEGWRRHYARTCRLWHLRLTERRAEAVAIVGEQRYRMWVAYLAGVSLAFTDGTIRLYQVLASKHQAEGFSQMPPTRAHLFVKQDLVRAAAPTDENEHQPKA